MTNRIVAAALVLAASLARPAGAQFPPDSLVNVEVLPDDITVRGVIDVMRGFAIGLGVRCQYCHVGEEGQPLAEFDFVSDDKATKRKARVMLEMLQSINDRHLTELPDRTTPNVTVQCATCHRGQSRPVMIEDVVLQAIEEDGIDAAKARYRALREEYHGSYTYDFTEFTLSFLGQSLIEQGKTDEAIGVLELNQEFFPNSAGIPFMMGEAYRTSGDTERAIAQYERALALNPEFRMATRRLSQLRGN